MDYFSGDDANHNAVTPINAEFEVRANDPRTAQHVMACERFCASVPIPEGPDAPTLKDVLEALDTANKEMEAVRDFIRTTSEPMKYGRSHDYRIKMQILNTLIEHARAILAAFPPAAEDKEADDAVE